MLMKPLALVFVGTLLVTTQAFADDEDAARVKRWHELRQSVFGDRAIKDGGGVVALTAPVRALDAALVPITLSMPGPKVKSVYLLIDENPSPLAGIFHFGPAADPREIKTRVRVDSYTYMHAVAETEDGQLYETAAFVKAAGGCSAPSGGDMKLALERLGKMKLKSVADAPAGMTELELLISHPNFNGMQMDQVTRNYTPARFIQSVTVTTAGTEIFKLDADISLSEDPAITFAVKPGSSSPIDVAVHDSTNADFIQRFDLPGRGA